ncbi:MAG TPA: sn-glycerol-3-phosphate ABC transporter ATP-binding protein UgpC [Vicinamibacterales bacterium]|nr:sn-glycerol-3-phosphate ABC transporter ATP-binding protein UgpC [Vicinamibacterales bacterium]
MAAIALHDVHKAFPTGHVAVRSLSLEVADGELLVLVGPSGCGKSTVLRLIAGLEDPTSGRIVIGGADVTGVPPQQRDLAMVFQSYALYPHKSVRDNLAFGLTVRGLAAADVTARVASAAASLGLEALLDRRPAQLSGGQRQRVALGRAIVREPRAFLLDEPLSNLDPLLRVATRAELALLHRRLGTTMIYVTHDQEEAMTLGTRIAVMSEGALEQLAPPLEAFARPATVFVARFVGAPAMNLWRARASRASGLRITTPAFVLDLPDGAHSSVTDGAEVWLGIRPHELSVTAPGQGDAAAEVAIVEPLGAQTTVHAHLEAAPEALVRVQVPSSVAVRAGDRVGLRLERTAVHLFDAATGRRAN